MGRTIGNRPAVFVAIGRMKRVEGTIQGKKLAIRLMLTVVAVGVTLATAGWRGCG